jgi:Lrp/AsnC family transcriptional regulator, leucine-responsive regulatory protein
MIKNQSSFQLDATDRAILRIIQTDASIKDADLARKINLSAPATHARLKRLERDGFVRGYAALLDRDALGFGLLCFVQVSLRAHANDLERDVQAAVSQLPEILECYQLTGQSDYLMKVVLRDRKHLESFLNARLTPLLKDAHIQTSVVLTEIKATHALPLDDG